MVTRLLRGSLLVQGIWIAASAAIAVISTSREGWSQGLLLGETGQPFHLPPVDPSLPTGRARELPEEVVGSDVPACSFEYSICVHPRVGDESAVVLESLRAVELAYSRTVVAMGLPPPRHACGAAGPRLTVLLDGSLDGALQDATTVREVPIALGAFDAASAVCRLRHGLRGRPLERAATICVGEAIALGLDPGMSPHLRRAYATHLWWITGGMATADSQAVEAFQASPERATFGVDRTQSSEGAALLFELLERRGGSPRAGELATAVVSRAGSRTQPSATEWNNEPDVVDVLRSSFAGTPLPWARLLGEFAFARGLLGSGAAQWSPLAQNLGWSALRYRPRFDWHIPVSSLPRRLLTRNVIEPTGSAFVWVDFDVSLGQNATLGMRAECEGPVAFEWELAKLEGLELKPSRVPIAFEDRALNVERTVNELQHTRALLIAGTNVGGVSASFPFDPDVAPYEPHACTIYLTRL